MNEIQKKLWLAWSKVRFLMLPRERRVRLEVTTDGRHLSFILVSLYEAGYGVQVHGGDWFFRELMLLRKTAPIPFLYGGKETECGISITDRPSTQDTGRSSLFVLDYDYFSGLNREGGSHGGTANTEVGEDLSKNESRENFNHNRARGQLRERATEGWPVGRESGSDRVKLHEYTRIEAEKAGRRLAGQAGAEFLNPSPSEHARDSENTSLIRCADNPAGARNAPEDKRSEIGNRGVAVALDGSPQGGGSGTARRPSLQGGTEALRSGLSALDSSSQALRMPYFMQPGALHEGFHKFDCKNPSMPRAIRLGFYGTHHPLYYTKHFRFPILPRTPILDRFVELFSDQFQRIDGDNLKEINARIAVSFDYSQSDQVKKSYLKRADYFTALEKTDFMLCPPGWCMPPSHNLVEAISRGVIPILNYPEYMIPGLEDGIDCLAFSTLQQMEDRIREALEMPQEQIVSLRANVLCYYREFLVPGIWWGRLLQDSGKSCTILVNHEADSVAKRDPDFLVAAAEFIGRFPAAP